MVQEFIWSPASDLDTGWTTRILVYRSTLVSFLGLSVVCVRAVWQFASPQHQCSITSNPVDTPSIQSGRQELHCGAWHSWLLGEVTAIPLYWKMPDTQRRWFVIWVLSRLLPDHQQGLWWNKGWGFNLSSLKSLRLSPQKHTFLVEVLSKSNSRKSKSM